MIEPKPNVTARYVHEGENYVVKFRNTYSVLMGLTLQAHELFIKEYGFEPDINKISMHVY